MNAKTLVGKVAGMGVMGVMGVMAVMGMAAGTASAGFSITENWSAIYMDEPDAFTELSAPPAGDFSISLTSAASTGNLSGDADHMGGLAWTSTPGYSMNSLLVVTFELTEAAQVRLDFDFTGEPHDNSYLWLGTDITTHSEHHEGQSGSELFDLDAGVYYFGGSANSQHGSPSTWFNLAIVPAPGVGALAGLGGLVAGCRRRRATA